MLFRINLATRTGLNRRLVSLVCGASCVLLMATMVGQMLLCGVSAGTVRQLDDEIVSRRGSALPGGPPVTAEDRALLKDSAAFYNDILARRAFSWSDMVQRLERTIPRGIAVTNLEPDLKAGTIKLEAYALHFADIQSCMEQIEASDDFDRVTLESHMEKTLWEEARGIAFSLSIRLVRS